MKHFTRQMFHYQKDPLAAIRRELDGGRTVVTAALAMNGTGLTELCFYWLRGGRLFHTRVEVEKILPVFGTVPRDSFYRVAGIQSNTATDGDGPEQLANRYDIAYALAHPGRVRFYVCPYGDHINAQIVYDMFIREWLKEADDEV